MSDQDGVESDEYPIAWTAIRGDEEVYSSDGERVGTVDEVLGTGPAGIFHGLVLRPGLFEKHQVVLADDVASITNRRVTLALDKAAVEQLRPYVPEDSFTLGFTGLLGRTLGWTKDEDRP